MQKFRRYFVAGIVTMFLLGAFFVWQAVFYFQLRTGNALVHALDVGQGDAIFIETPNGKQILIDGGPDGAVARRLGEIMLPWDRAIDAVILTHPHADHAAGLIEILRRYKVGFILESGAPYTTPEYYAWRKIISEKNIPVYTAKRGVKITDGAMNLTALLPDKMPDNGLSNVHDAMVVLRMDFASTSALLMGDAEKKLEYKLAASNELMSADLLKVGHHGSKTSTLKFFLAGVKPKYAVISAGRKNRYGHPAGEVIERLKSRGIQIFRTDISGTVTFISDGRILVPAVYR